jgi:hypothetical protein
MNVKVALSAIHGFSGSKTVFWQRHGIAASSAALGEGFSLGAAHFFGGLPRSSDRSVLAAKRVPDAHLQEGHGRSSHSWLPQDHFVYQGALVRLFV